MRVYFKKYGNNTIAFLSGKYGDAVEIHGVKELEKKTKKEIRRYLLDREIIREKDKLFEV